MRKVFLIIAGVGMLGLGSCAEKELTSSTDNNSSTSATQTTNKGQANGNAQQNPSGKINKDAFLANPEKSSKSMRESK